MSVPVIRTAAELRGIVAAWRQEGLKIAVVPMMGALHDGHLSLVHAALARADRVVATIFVNPKQFNNPNGLAAYPRTEHEDAAKHDWWLYWRLKSWLGRNTARRPAGALCRIYARPRTGERSGWRMGGKTLAQFADAKRLRYPDRGLRIPNGWNATPDESFRKEADKFWEATRALASL